jgi:hypothetical protein
VFQLHLEIVIAKFVKSAFSAIIILLFCGIHSFASASYSDSSIIFVTKQQFDKDSGTVTCHCLVQEKELLFWEDFKFQAQGRVRIKDDNGKESIFTPGSIFGFSINGIKFMFVPSEEMYLAVLGKTSMIDFFVERSGKMTYIKYANPRNGTVRWLTRKHAEADFKGDNLLLPKLLSLNKKLTDYNRISGFNRKDYVECRNIISGISD